MYSSCRLLFRFRLRHQQLLYRTRLQQHHPSFLTTSRNFSQFQSTETTNNKNDLESIRPVYDKSLNWEDWFTPEEYGNAWEYPDPQHQDGETNPLITQSQDYALSPKRRLVLEPLDGDVALDSASRHLIRQLQKSYNDGFQEEPIDLQICRTMIGRLLESAETIANSKDYKGEVDTGATLIRQRVLRSEALLRTMELFWDFIPDLVEPTDESRRLVRTEWTQHKPAFEYTVPTYELYVMVARGLESLRFPKEYQKLYNSDVPWICQDLVLRMHQYYQRKGLMYLKSPSVEAWNQALACWANAHGDRDHPEKAVNAAAFLMDMKLQFNVTLDASSYGHVLRACAHHDRNERAQELGSKVAAKLWRKVLQDELKTQSFAPTPFFFVFLMRALANLAPEDKDTYLREAWEEACRASMVNEHVLYELEQASTPLFRELLKEYRGKVDTATIYKSGDPRTRYDKTYHLELLTVLPVNWKEGTQKESR